MAPRRLDQSFEWATGPDAVTLDVFGHALRESSPWGQDLLGLYAGPQTVAEMKRTNRDKDWSFITALGLRIIEADDERGWLHVFTAEALTELLKTMLRQQVSDQEPTERLRRAKIH